MKKVNFLNRVKLAMLALFVLSFVFVGCKPDPVVEPDVIDSVRPEEGDNILGKWVDDYGSIYEVTATAFKNYGTGWSAYEGNNLQIVYTNDAKTAGYIYIKYTKAANADWSYSETAPDVGKWYVIAFKDLTATTNKISGAYKEGGKTSTETIKEAAQEFTIENGYFAIFTPCSKQ